VPARYLNALQKQKCRLAGFEPAAPATTAYKRSGPLASSPMQPEDDQPYFWNIPEPGSRFPAAISQTNRGHRRVEAMRLSMISEIFDLVFRGTNLFSRPITSKVKAEGWAPHRRIGFPQYILCDFAIAYLSIT